MSIGFVSTIKPYFTDCYRDHMQFMMDLWSASDVQGNWQAIHDAVQDGSMPQDGCPDGTWTSAQAQKFLSDFQAWKDAGFPP